MNYMRYAVIALVMQPVFVAASDAGDSKVDYELMDVFRPKGQKEVVQQQAYEDEYKMLTPCQKRMQTLCGTLCCLVFVSPFFGIYIADLATPQSCVRVTISPKCGDCYDYYSTPNNPRPYSAGRVCGILNATEQEQVTKEIQAVCADVTTVSFEGDACSVIRDCGGMHDPAASLKDFCFRFRPHNAGVDASKHAAKIALLPSTHKLERNRQLGLQSTISNATMARLRNNHTSYNKGKQGKRGR